MKRWINFQSKISGWTVKPHIPDYYSELGIGCIRPNIYGLCIYIVIVVLSLKISSNVNLQFQCWCTIECAWLWNYIVAISFSCEVYWSAWGRSCEAKWVIYVFSCIFKVIVWIRVPCWVSFVGYCEIVKMIEKWLWNNKDSIIFSICYRVDS